MRKPTAIIRVRENGASARMADEPNGEKYSGSGHILTLSLKFGRYYVSTFLLPFPFSFKV